MGICESDLNSKKLNLEHLAKQNNKNINYPKKAHLNNDIKENHNPNLSKKLHGSYPTNSMNMNINLQKYEPSLDNSNIIQSDINSKSKEEEIIIKGKVNLNCENKENDFDNESFMNLIKSNGGIVLKEEIDKDEKNNQKTNEITYDFEKDDISEIKSQSSLDKISHSKNTVLSEINGKKFKNELKSQMSKGKSTDYSLAHNRLDLEANNAYDKRTKYTTSTNRPKINLNTYLNGIFSNDYNDYNSKIQIQNNDNNILSNTKGFSIPLDNIQKPEYDHINNRFQNSLISNYNNKTNDTINEALTGSFISVPKNDEKIPEFFFKMNGNEEDIISNLSFH